MQILHFAIQLLKQLAVQEQFPFYLHDQAWSKYPGSYRHEPISAPKNTSETPKDTSLEQQLNTPLFKAIFEQLPCIVFNPDGTNITANPLFLNAVGYDLPEIQGEHHRMFCDSETINS